MKAELEFWHITIPAYLLKYSIKLFFINEIKLSIRFSIYNAWLMNHRPSLVVANLALADQGAY